MSLDSLVPVELHIGHIDAISRILTLGSGDLVEGGPALIEEGTSQDIVGSSGYRILPLNDSEKFESIGRAKQILSMDECLIKLKLNIDMSNAAILASQYRIACLSGDKSKSFWFEADPKRDNKNYNPVWGYCEGEPYNVTNVILKPPMKEVGGFLSPPRIGLVYGQDRPDAGVTSACMLLLKKKEDMETLYSKIITAQTNHRAISFKDLYAYFLQDEDLKAIIEEQTPELTMKQFKLSPAP